MEPRGFLRSTHIQMECLSKQTDLFVKYFQLQSLFNSWQNLVFPCREIAF